MTYYDILGVPHDATQEQIKQSYRMQIRFFHPDLFDGPPEVADIKTKQLNEAYGVLGNPELRSQYDRILKINQTPPNTQQRSSEYAYTKTAQTQTPYRGEDVKRKRRKRETKKQSNAFYNAVIVVLSVILGVSLYHLWTMFQGDTVQEEQQTPTIYDTHMTKDEFMKLRANDNAGKDQTFSEWSIQSHSSPIETPASGTILSGKEYYGGSEISVTADSHENYVVSLKTVGGTELVAFFVRAGDTVTIGVPAQRLCVYFACGDKWYGYEKGKMFGKDTVYSKDDEPRDFTEYTWEYTMYPVNNGNFSETPSNEDEFF